MGSCCEVEGKTKGIITRGERKSCRQEALKHDIKGEKIGGCLATNGFP